MRHRNVGKELTRLVDSHGIKGVVTQDVINYTSYLQIEAAIDNAVYNAVCITVTANKIKIIGL